MLAGAGHGDRLYFARGPTRQVGHADAGASGHVGADKVLDVLLVDERKICAEVG